MTSGAAPDGAAPADAAAPTTEQPVAPAPPAPQGAPHTAPPLAIPGLPSDRPELHVAAAFAGGLVLARILKRIAG